MWNLGVWMCVINMCACISFCTADDTMDVGGLISTNNLIVGKEIVVSNSNKLLWTMSHTLVNHYSHEM